MGQVKGPGFGDAPCSLPSGCRRFEVEGMDFCLVHMPDEMLDEAEEVTGIKRCRYQFGAPDACHSLAVRHSDPPRCGNHIGAPGSVASKHASMRVIDGAAANRAAEIIKIHGNALAVARPVEDPYGELMQLAGEMRTWKDLLQQRVALLRVEQYRYAGQSGEQTRAEIILYERAIERYGTMLIQIAKLNLDARLVGIRQQTLEMLDRALSLAFTKAKVPPEKQAEARETFRKHIKMAS